jgi:hypothetical protein
MVLSLALALAVGASCQIRSPAHTVALVELYTSQGCSSCPPADQWLARLDDRAGRVVPLSLHVGYWDYIGWKDPFAKREFNERQRWLAERNRNRTVYTPGVFVNARETPRWSDGAAFETTVRAIAARPAAATLELAVERVQGARIDVRARGELATAREGDAKLFVALTESGLATRVKAGENRGETLQNSHVARGWSGPLPLGDRRVSLPVPSDEPARLALVAFVQDVGSGEVLQAVRLRLADCPR